MTIKPTPITLITGYLGSGKTTLINHILSHANGHKMAVIVNDIGEVNIDAELIDSAGVVSAQDDSLVALQNGCICCTLKSNLLDQLADLVNSHRFDHILIEASGICEPVPIAQSICYMVDEFARQNLPMFYYLDAIVSVTDALRLKEEFGYGQALTEEEHEGEESIESLVFQQLEFCDLVLLNKASELTKEELAKVTACIRGIQREAVIIPTDYAEVDIEKIIDTHLFDFQKAANSAAWAAEFDSFENEHDADHDEDDDDDDHEHGDHDHEHEDHDHGHGHHHHHHHHEHGLTENDDEGTAEEYGIQTFVYYRRRPFKHEAFVAWARENSHYIIRSKGVLYFVEDPSKRCVYETAGRQIKLTDLGLWYSENHTPQEIANLRKNNKFFQHDWDDVYHEKLVKLVFIGQNLDKKAIKAELDQI